MSKGRVVVSYFLWYVHVCVCVCGRCNERILNMYGWLLLPQDSHLISKQQTCFGQVLFVVPLLHLLLLHIKTIMGTDVVVDDVVLPSEVTLSKPLPLLGHGVTEIEIHFLQIKHTAIGVYMEPQVVTHLQKWKGKTGKELAEDDEFFEAVAAAPVETELRVVVIKEIKASQYGTQLESAVRDRLAAVDKYEEEEEIALEKVVEFFPAKYLKKGSFFTFKIPPAGPAEITITSDEKEESKMTVENKNVVEMIKKWYLGGTRGVSPSTILCLANTLSAELSK